VQELVQVIQRLDHVMFRSIPWQIGVPMITFIVGFIIGTSRMTFRASR
jgi:hypothetical protein